MGFDDMSDEDKQALMNAMKGQSDPSQGIGSLNPNSTPSFASQNVPADVSQSLNSNENNIDSQNSAKQAALDNLRNTGLTPMNQKIAEGMGGMGSIENVAMKEAQPMAQAAVKAATPYVDEAASGIKSAFPKLQQWFQAGTKTFPAANTAEAMQVHKALERTGAIGPNRTLVGPFHK